MKAGRASWVSGCLMLSCFALGLSGCGKKNPSGPGAQFVPTPVPGMALIHKGSFALGSDTTEVGRRLDEGPQTVVTLTNDFWMDSTEVTQARYVAVRGSNPSHFQPPIVQTTDLTLPVEQVSWDDAVAYCGSLTNAERAAGRCPTTWSYRLPTEAEWEYAARAGTTTRFSYGDDPGYTLLTDHAWYYSNSKFTTHPVGKQTVNAWGLSDMYGNVFEWCQDWYGAYPGKSASDPKGPATGLKRVIRGGCWSYGARDCRSAQRNYSIHRPAPTNSNLLVGFRVVLAPVRP